MKKIIIIAVITVVTLGGILGGVAIASADEENQVPEEIAPMADISSLAERVAEKYEELTGNPIDSEKLVEAFTEVRKDIRSEAMDKMLDRLVEDGRINEEQAQEFKDWIADAPDLGIGPGPDGRNFFGVFGQGPGGRFFGRFHGRCNIGDVPEAPEQ